MLWKDVREPRSEKDFGGMQLTKAQQPKLRPMNTSIGCSLKILEATGVPTPLDEAKKPMDQSIKGRFVRVSVIQMVSGRYQLSHNAIQVPGYWESKNTDLWLFDDSINPGQHLSSMFFRSTKKEAEQLIENNAALCFELVVLVQRGVSDAPTEMSCGWAELPIRELKNSVKHKLEIKGGTPMALT